MDGMEHVHTARMYARSVTTATCNAGTTYANIAKVMAKQETLVEASSRGPTDPIGTASPWTCQRDTMVVRKMDGKVLA